MKSNYLIFVIVFCFVVLFSSVTNYTYSQKVDNDKKNVVIKLPAPSFSGNVSVETAIYERRSIRDYKKTLLTINDLSQILWAAQGITDTTGYRTAPSAGASYSLILYVVVGNVNEVPSGIYRFTPKGHELIKLIDGDKRNEIFKISLNQIHIRDAGFLIIYAEDKDISKIYGKKASQKVNTEIGCAIENVYLQGLAINLGVGVSTSYNELKLAEILKTGQSINPLIIQTIGNISKK